MNKPVMPEPMRAGDFNGVVKVYRAPEVRAHHAAWEAHCAALEARLREVEGLAGKWREIAEAWDALDCGADHAEERRLCADELTATLEQSKPTANYSENKNG